MRTRTRVLIMSCLLILVGVFVWTDSEGTSSAIEDIEETMLRGYLSVYYSINGLGRSFWLEEATNTFELVAEAQPDNAEANLMAALTHEILGHYNEAAIFYQKADILAPQLGISVLLGDMWHRIGEYEKARDAYEKSLEYDEKMIKALQGLAYTLECLGDETTAQRRLEQLIEADPTRVESFVALSNFLYRKGDMSPALDILEQVDVSYRFNESYQVQLGLIYFDTQMTEEACRAFGNAIYLGNTDQWVNTLYTELGCQ